jgi:hypothetical protein
MKALRTLASREHLQSEIQERGQSIAGSTAIVMYLYRPVPLDFVAYDSKNLGPLWEPIHTLITTRNINLNPNPPQTCPLYTATKTSKVAPCDILQN